MKTVLLCLIRFYRRHLSRFSHGCCRFSPTCSAYALEAIQVHGAIKGTAMSIWRVLRCNPLCKGGYDPVPPKKEKKPKNNI